MKKDYLDGRRARYFVINHAIYSVSPLLQRKKDTHADESNDGTKEKSFSLSVYILLTLDVSNFG